MTSLVAGQSVWTPDGSGIITVARWVLEKYKSFPHNPRLGCNVQWIQAGSANTTRARNVLTPKANLPWSTSLLAVWKLWHLLAPMSQGDSQRFLQIIHDFSRAHIHIYLYFGPFLLYFPRHRSPHYNNYYWSKTQQMIFLCLFLDKCITKCFAYLSNVYNIQRDPRKNKWSIAIHF